ncbi:MAG: NAD(P)/FAD-dependent oxidoreductase [Armatimonadota bacterium]
MKQTADVVIIGGGLMGCASAYYTARCGMRVVLLERGQLGEGASGACEGFISLQSKRPGAPLDMARRSADIYAGLTAELDTDIEYDPSGGLTALEREDELAEGATLADRLRRAGLTAELLQGDELRQVAPALAPHLAGAVYCPDEARVGPLRVLFAFADGARRHGARICAGVSAERILCERGRVTGVQTPSGAWSSPRVVDAAGAWAPGLAAPLGVHLPLRPRRGQVIVTEQAPALLRPFLLSASYISAKLAPHTGNGRITAAAVAQMRDGNFLIGGTREFVGDDVRNSPDALRDIMSCAVRLVPALRELSIIRAFAGLRPHSDSGEAIIGHVDGLEGLIVAAGHGGDGVALAPVTGQMVASLASESLDDPTTPICEQNGAEMQI